MVYAGSSGMDPPGGRGSKSGIELISCRTRGAGASQERSDCGLLDQIDARRIDRCL